jgi:hypothetical protein
MTIKTAAIAEIENVLSLRRSAHRNIPGEKEKFIDRKFQKRYDTLKAVLTVIKDMEDKEFNHYINRALRRERAKEQPPSLFQNT